MSLAPAVHLHKTQLLSLGDLFDRVCSVTIHRACMKQRVSFGLLAPKRRARHMSGSANKPPLSVYHSIYRELPALCYVSPTCYSTSIITKHNTKNNIYTNQTQTRATASKRWLLPITIPKPAKGTAARGEVWTANPSARSIRLIVGFRA